MDIDFTKIREFSVGRELASLIATSGILHKAWEGICSVNKVKGDSFLLKEDKGVVIVAFPSFHNEDCTVPDSKYGECNIQNVEIFSGGLNGDDAKPALVHKGALNRFLHVLDNSDFKAKMEGLKERNIIFVGHSIGGAVAALATIWFLEKRLRNTNSFCITFGAPLFGNDIFQEAIGREDWLGRFCHVVRKYDIVPRMYLGPYESIFKSFKTIAPHWQKEMGIDCAGLSHSTISQACRTLVFKVLECTSTIANNPANNEPGGRSSFVPIGTFMFCSTEGAACFEDSEAVLKLLHFSMQSQGEIPIDKIADNCIPEHTRYDHTLEHIDESVLEATEFANFFSNSPFETGICLELEAIGVAAQDDHAFSALKHAGEVKNEQEMNSEKLNLKLSKNQSYMAELEWYKTRCKDNKIGYYDAFKQHDAKRDFHVNLARRNLGNFWDNIVDQEEKHVLPSDFRTRNKWINAGTAYRRLVEPLDIAYHYRTDKENKSYLSDRVRPHRHIVLEKWMKDKERTRTGREGIGRTSFASLTEDTVFWARLEDAFKAPISPLQEELENDIGRMIANKSISVEVFLEQSSFMKWWEQYSHIQLPSPQWRSSSPLFPFMEKDCWKQNA